MTIGQSFWYRNRTRPNQHVIHNTQMLRLHLPHLKYVSQISISQSRWGHSKKMLFVLQGDLHIHVQMALWTTFPCCYSLEPLLSNDLSTEYFRYNAAMSLYSIAHSKVFQNVRHRRICWLPHKLTQTLTSIQNIDNTAAIGRRYFESPGPLPFCQIQKRLY